MAFRPQLLLRSLPLTVLALTLGYSPPSLAAGEEARARNLERDAMDNDYLGTDFKAAVAKLENARRLCSNDQCPKDLQARIFRSLGTVYSAGLNQHEAAVEAFKEMLRLEPTLTPDANYLTGAVQRAFDEAKAAAGPGAVVVEKTVAVLTETPWTEQATFRPLPIYVELPEGAEATRLLVRYKGPKMADWAELQLPALGKGFGGLVPCSAVESEGTLEYFVTAFDANLDRVASAGSATEPRKVTLKKAITGRQPALPGAEPPEECTRPVERLSCETDDDCPGDQLCDNLQCVDKASVQRPTEDTSKLPRANHLTLSFSPDLMLMGNSKGVCTSSVQADGQYSCFYSGPTQVDGADVVGTGGSVNGGLGMGSMRVMLGYDRVFLGRFSAGARLGFAFLGTPKRSDDVSAFLPFHAEARFAAHLFSDSYARTGLRPYALLSGGFANFAGKVSSKLNTQGESGTTNTSTVDVYQQGGDYFGGVGLGVEYAVSLQLAMRLELAVRQTFGDASATLLAPSLGFAYGL